MRRHPSLAALLWRAPLALLSFVFYKCLRRGFRFIMARYNRTHPEVRFRWRPLTAETLRMRIALPAIMTTGPRWNTHATVATAGPLTVTANLAIDAACAQRSAGAWSIVVCTFPAMQTVTNFGSANTSASIALPPGDYWLALRYYHCATEPALPAVIVDGRAAVPSAELPARPNDFYKDLIGRGGALYACMHYYMWILLRYRDRLPQSLVEREYLPLANPDTEFFFGSLLRGDALQIDLAPQVLAAHSVYLTLYSPASFPLAWHQVLEARDTTPAAADCSYLIRVHGSGTPLDRSWVKVEVLENIR